MYITISHDDNTYDNVMTYNTHKSDRGMNIGLRFKYYWHWSIGLAGCYTVAIGSFIIVIVIVIPSFS
jgi:hypothetical protein